MESGGNMELGGTDGHHLQDWAGKGLLDETSLPDIRDT